MLADLTGSRLPNVNVGQLGAMRRRYRTFQIEQHVHPGGPRSTRRRQRRSARTEADALPASPIVAALSASSPATLSGPRSAATPARTVGSAVRPDVPSTPALAA